MKFIQAYTYPNQDRWEVHRSLLLQEEIDLLEEVANTKDSITCDDEKIPQGTNTH